MSSTMIERIGDTHRVCRRWSNSTLVLERYDEADGRWIFVDRLSNPGDTVGQERASITAARARIEAEA